MPSPRRKLRRSCRYASWNINESRGGRSFCKQTVLSTKAVFWFQVLVGASWNRVQQCPDDSGWIERNSVYDCKYAFRNLLNGFEHEPLYWSGPFLLAFFSVLRRVKLSHTRFGHVSFCCSRVSHVGREEKDRLAALAAKKKALKEAASQKKQAKPKSDQVYVITSWSTNVLCCMTV